MMGSRREPSGGILCLRTAAAKGAGKPSGRSDHGSMRTLPIDRAARLLDTPPHFVVRTVFRKGPRMSGTTITDRSTPTAMGSGCVRRDTSSLSFARSRQGTVLLLDDGLAGIYSVATLSEERGKGIGGHATAETLRVAQALGYRVVCCSRPSWATPSVSA